ASRVSSACARCQSRTSGSEVSPILVAAFAPIDSLPPRFDDIDPSLCWNSPLIPWQLASSPQARGRALARAIDFDSNSVANALLRARTKWETGSCCRGAEIGARQGGTLSSEIDGAT